jgi:hypothetical protein
MIRTPIWPSAQSPQARPSFQLKQQQEEGGEVESADCQESEEVGI